VGNSRQKTEGAKNGQMSQNEVERELR